MELKVGDFKAAYKVDGLYLQPTWHEEPEKPRARRGDHVPGRSAVVELLERWTSRASWRPVPDDFATARGAGKKLQQATERARLQIEQRKRVSGSCATDGSTA